MRKQLDPRIPILINNNVKKNHRSFIVLVGDKGRDQIVNLHFLLSQARVSARPSVLWCYKKELGFTSHRKKREAKIKRDVKRGVREPNEQNPFEIFVTVTDIRYTHYKESQKILGNTYGMCVLQDFEAITPNLLARTIETVEGGGLVVLLLKTMTSLKQLYTMTMDVHARYRTSSHDSVVARFNERFILSLGSCDDCLVLDDELNVLPLSRGKDITPIEDTPGKNKEVESELKELKATLEDTKPAGDLIKLAKTIDQAQAILTFIDAIAEKTLSSTVTLTAARGRGKSAALGLAIAAALAHGYSNIFVTSPSPENLKTLFEFIFKGMDALGYEEHLDYDIAQSTNPDFNKAIVRVNVFKEHRQTIQYIQPEDAHVLGQAELVVIDEAAAIPLPLVKNLIGPYLVFLASTINGYEGTGRSLSLKLIQQLRESTRPSLTKDLPGGHHDDDNATTASSSKKPTHKPAPKARTLREIKLETPIRYSAGDKVEKWLNSVLCLDASVIPKAPTQGCPHPSTCELFYVSRDTLFSYHPASEVFLQRMMALYVASHYKNQPNDLQLLSDAPAHHLFVLLPPIKDDESHLPEPLVVLQVALEGNISREAIMDGLGRGLRAGGDMIPWLVSQQFQEGRFGMLSGARVVRIACHPDYANMGYGSRALQALNSFYSGEYFNLDESTRMETEYPDAAAIDPKTDLLTDKPTVRAVSAMPPLLQRLTERKPEALDYLGVSYGLTPQLLRFWKRAGYVPLYIRQTTSELTGEHACVMVRGLNSSVESELEWLGEFAKDFRKRFLSLLSFKFREFGSVTALSVLEAANAGLKAHDQDKAKDLAVSELSILLTPFDLKRLESYANNMLDYHVILDLLPTVASLYFQKRLGDDVRLSAVQSSILLALGLQRKPIEEVETELQITVSQGLALFVKVIRKISKRLVDIQKAAISAELPDVSAKSASSQGPTSMNWKPVAVSLEDELNEAGDEVTSALREKQREMIDSLDLQKYAIDDATVDWTVAETQVTHIARTGGKASTIVSIKSTAPTAQKRKADDGDNRDAGKDKKSTRRGGKKNDISVLHLALPQFLLPVGKVGYKLHPTMLGDLEAVNE
ncbi:RNA cytidine acetyltransferase [Hypsizygus marmoreus]|uniref:RNA cytidine acetyltransferase n=1 Tax=Hypsizygus marmoreus TaxID=39966 RepID=A0A369JHH5_HYPMA|nr:RNA cytidine acetyltransferase [Hypsizygus marmoreus]